MPLIHVYPADVYWRKHHLPLLGHNRKKVILIFSCSVFFFYSDVTVLHLSSALLNLSVRSKNFQHSSLTRKSDCIIIQWRNAGGASISLKLLTIFSKENPENYQHPILSSRWRLLSESHDVMSVRVLWDMQTQSCNEYNDDPAATACPSPWDKLLKMEPGIKERRPVYALHYCLYTCWVAVTIWCKPRRQLISEAIGQEKMCVTCRWYTQHK